MTINFSKSAPALTPVAMVAVPLLVLGCLLITGCQQPTALYEPVGMPTPPPQSPPEITEVDDPADADGEGDVTELAEDDNGEPLADDASEDASITEDADAEGKTDTTTAVKATETTKKGIAKPTGNKAAALTDKSDDAIEPLPADLPEESPPEVNEPE